MIRMRSESRRREQEGAPPRDAGDRAGDQAGDQTRDATGDRAGDLGPSPPPLPSALPPPLPPPPTTTDWREVRHFDGRTYYHNRRTDQVGVCVTYHRTLT